MAIMYPFLIAAKINTIYPIAFVIGYGLKKRDVLFRKKGYIAISIVMVAAICLRLAFRNRFDGTVLYDTVVVDFSQTVLGLWIFLTLMILSNNVDFIKHIAGSQFMRWTAAISYYVYITHYYFLGKQVNLHQMPGGTIVQIFGFVGLSLVSAVLLRGLDKGARRIFS